MTRPLLMLIIQLPLSSKVPCLGTPGKSRDETAGVVSGDWNGGVFTVGSPKYAESK